MLRGRLLGQLKVEKEKTYKTILSFISIPNPGHSKYVEIGWKQIPIDEIVEDFGGDEQIRLELVEGAMEIDDLSTVWACPKCSVALEPEEYVIRPKPPGRKTNLTVTKYLDYNYLYHLEA